MNTRFSNGQVQAELLALQCIKKDVRQFTAFGDDNHAAIDAQCAVLREGMSMDEVYDAYGGEEDILFAQNVLDAALSAHDWLHAGPKTGLQCPSTEWATLAA
jgi:ABC-type sugar transport system substrate-binding protein